MGRSVNPNLRAVRKAAARYGAIIVSISEGRGKHATITLQAADGHEVRLQISLGKIETFKQEGWVRQALTRPARPRG